jgi:hypothetical protein
MSVHAVKGEAVAPFRIVRPAVEKPTHRNPRDVTEARAQRRALVSRALDSAIKESGVSTKQIYIDGDISETALWGYRDEQKVDKNASFEFVLSLPYEVQRDVIEECTGRLLVDEPQPGDPKGDLQAIAHLTERHAIIVTKMVHALADGEICVAEQADIHEAIHTLQRDLATLKQRLSKK